MATVAGIDGCPAGWVCVSRELGGDALDVRIFDDIRELAVLAPVPEIVAIDVPIGLTDAGKRECDVAARRWLGRPRGSSVFPAPIRPMLKAGSYAEACRIVRDTDGRGLTVQAWSILPKIAEVDAFLCEDTSRLNWIREVHPEVSFQTWNDGAAIVHRKKSSAGRAERQLLVAWRYGDACEIALADIPRRQCARDDLLDAFAALWTAERLARGEALVLPDEPPTDSRGLPMAIYA